MSIRLTTPCSEAVYSVSAERWLHATCTAGGPCAAILCLMLSDSMSHNTMLCADSLIVIAIEFGFSGESEMERMLRS